MAVLLVRADSSKYRCTQGSSPGRSDLGRVAFSLVLPGILSDLPLCADIPGIHLLGECPAQLGYPAQRQRVACLHWARHAEWNLRVSNIYGECLRQPAVRPGTHRSSWHAGLRDPGAGAALQPQSVRGGKRSASEEQLKW